MHAEGFRVRATRGGSSVEEWVPLGWQISVPTEPKPLLIAYGNKQTPLPIGLVLRDFQVDWDEGTDTPAGFKSTLDVVDRETGDTTTGQCWMNHPMSVPDTWFATLTGLTYKLSQASWNPQNLSQSSIQILRDPGWSLKWIGSLIIVSGIFSLFYLRPYPMDQKSRMRRARKNGAPDEACPCTSYRIQSPARRTMKARLYILILLLALTLPGTGARADTLDFHQFGLLAIQDAGRRKPVDTFARETLLRISGRRQLHRHGQESLERARFPALGPLRDARLEEGAADPHPLPPAHREARARCHADAGAFSLDELAGATALPALLQQGQEFSQQEKEVPRELKEAENLATRMEALAHLMDNSAFTIVPPAAGRSERPLECAHAGKRQLRPGRLQGRHG